MSIHYRVHLIKYYCFNYKCNYFIQSKSMWKWQNKHQKCYKLHGFPSRYKFTKGKNATSSAKQVSKNDGSQFTYDQHQRILALLKPQASASASDMISSASVNQASSNTQTQDHLFTNMSGNPSFISHSSLDAKHVVFASSLHFFKKSNIDSKYAPQIIHTGATDHMICSITLFTTITFVVSKLVKLPNGQHASVTHIGTVKISENFILTNVLCIPSFFF